MPALEFHSTSEITQFKKIKETLQNPAFAAWIFCEDQWIKILAAKNFNNISQLGLAFEANVDILAPDSFEISTFVESALVDLRVPLLTKERFPAMLQPYLLDL